MSKQIISTPNAPAAIGTYSQAVRVGNTIWVSGQIPMDPATKELVKGDMEAQVRQVFDNLKAIVAAAGASFDDVVKATIFLIDLSHFALVNKVMAEYFREPYPARAAVGVAVAAARRAGRSGVHRRPVIDSKPVTVLRGVGDSLAARLRALGVETTQDLLFLLPLRYEDRTRVVPLGELRPGQRAAVEGEVLLTEVAFRGRRQMLCRIARRFGFPDAAILLLHRAAAAGPGARRAHPLLRRGAPRPQGPGDRASGISARRSERAAVAGGTSHADLSQHRRRHPGTAAPAGRHGARSDRRGAISRIGCPPAVLADSRLPSLRDALQYVHRPPADAPVDLLLELAPSGAAPPGVRGIAGSSAVAQAAAPAHTERSGLAAAVGTAL